MLSGGHQIRCLVLIVECLIAWVAWSNTSTYKPVIYDGHLGLKKETYKQIPYALLSYCPAMFRRRPYGVHTTTPESSIGNR